MQQAKVHERREFRLVQRLPVRLGHVQFELFLGVSGAFGIGVEVGAPFDRPAFAEGLEGGIRRLLPPRSRTRTRLPAVLRPSRRSWQC